MPQRPILYGCVRCMTFKPRESFALPDGKRKRKDKICLECREAAKVERLVRREARRVTKEIDGVLSRRCSRCRTWKPLTTEHYYKSKVMRDGSLAFDYWCKKCQSVRTTARAKQRRHDPEMRTRELKVANERTRRWRQRNPTASRAAAQRYKKRVKADPKRYAEMLESQRIAYRLRKERRGGTVDPRRQRKTAANAYQTPGIALDSAPIREWLEVVVTREMAPANGYEPQQDLRNVADRLGVHERRLLSLRKGEYQTVSYVSADALVTHYGLAVRVNGFGPVEVLEDLYPELSEDSA